MHETSLIAQTPQRSRSQFVGCVLRSNLNDSIACTDVMQEIASPKVMDDLVPQGLRNRKGTTASITVPSGRCDDGFYMAAVRRKPSRRKT